MRLRIGVAALAVVATGCGGGGGAPTTQELVETLLAGESREERVEAADELAPRAGPAVVRQVSRAAGSQAAVEALRDSLARLYRGSPNAPGTRTRAVEAIAAVGDDPSTEIVVSAIARDRNPRVAAAATDALVGALGRREAVSRLIAARDRAGRRRIDDTLVGMGVPAVRQLFPRLSDFEWARRIVGRIGNPALPFLRRELAGAGFDGDVDAAYGLLAAGARRDAAKAVSAMMDVVGGTNDSRRFTAMGVLADAGRPTVDAIVPVLRRPYDELDPVGKKQWEWGIQLLMDTTNASPRSTKHLVAALRSKDYDLVADIHMFYVRLGRPGTEPALVDALDAEGDTIMALNFLNSGNPKLDRGARAWAASRGYTVTSSPGAGAPASWGSG